MQNLRQGMVSIYLAQALADRRIKVNRPDREAAREIVTELRESYRTHAH